MDKFILVKSSKFRVLPGEEKDLVNEGMYGKALAMYLQAKLGERGYEVPFFCCEDWGWWVELKNVPFDFGVCIYSGPVGDGPIVFSCTDSAHASRKWSWRKFRFMGTEAWSKKLHEDLMAIFKSDNEVEIVGVSDEPFFGC
jgi:hypothetical protein